MIKWHVVDASGKNIYGTYGLRRREDARQYKNILEKEALDEWNSDVFYPLKIVREEWELKSSKVVR